jgi:hypothetical protein
MADLTARDLEYWRANPDQFSKPRAVSLWRLRQTQGPQRAGRPQFQFLMSCGPSRPSERADIGTR